MAHSDCTINGPHKKHSVNVGNMRYDLYEHCAGIPTAAELVRIEQKQKLRELKLAIKLKKSTERHARKMTRLAVHS